jgi:hypothetical protein
VKSGTAVNHSGQDFRNYRDTGHDTAPFFC